MQAATFLVQEGWTPIQEFGIKVYYDGKECDAAVTQYNLEKMSLYVATLEDGKELLLIKHTLHPVQENKQWLPVDVKNIGLAAMLGQAIQNCHRE